MIKIKYLIRFLGVSLFLAGCEKQCLPNDGYIPEVIKIDAQEIKNTYFFDCPNFDINSNLSEAIGNLFKNSRNNGIENIGFMLISNQSIPIEIQEKVKKQLYTLMYKYGFINSRIIDSGTCVYTNARNGIRIDVFEYDVKIPDCSKWTEYIGDTDTSKNLPKYGAADAYNTIEMISNKADFVAPRKYKGQETKAAIDVVIVNSGKGN